jgi:hypothetical protein
MASTADFRRTIDRIEVAAGVRKARRSDLYVWMFSRADQLEPLITQWTWQTVAAAICRLGIRDGAGNPPTAERCRKTWLAVRQAKGRTARTITAPPLSIAKPQNQPPTNQPPVDEEDDVLLRAGDGTILTMKRPT